jgi:hypothetical protein
MRSRALRLRAGLLFVLALLCCGASRVHAQGAADFVLRDFLGREWRNESVRFPLSAAQLKHAQASAALVGPGRRAVAYQVVAGEGGAPGALEFLADLDPYETRSYRFAESRAPASGDLKVEETGDVIRLENSRVGISIRTRLVPGQGPIEAFRMPSGRWVGDSVLKAAPSVRAYSAKLVVKGPVFAEILCRFEFSNGGRWDVRLRLQAHEPVVLVDESFSAGEGTTLTLKLNRGLGANRLLYRRGSGEVGRLATADINAPGEVPLFVLEPWLHWWERDRQGTWFGLYDQSGADLLAIGAADAATWVDPAQKADVRAPVRLAVAARGGEVNWTLPLSNGARKWMIGGFDRETSLTPSGGKNVNVAPLPQQAFIKHGAFALDRIKDYVLDWNGEDAGHPRLIVTEADLAPWRRGFRVNPAKLAALATTPLHEEQMDDAIAYYFATGDAALSRQLAATAVRWMQRAVEMYLRQDAVPTLGFAPHHQQAVLLPAVLLADVVWSSPHLSPELRQRLKAQLAFLGYTVNRADYWSPARGFNANPNMTSTVATFQTMLGCVIVSHPLAKTWIANGMRELKNNQLDTWADDNGGWIEAPHYALASYDNLLGSFIATRNAGINEYLYDPKMKKVIEWLAKISTPPDSLANGRRRLPPVGNTYMREPSGEFGTVAYLWRSRDPAFAAEMQWMHRQHGSYLEPGVGGFAATLAGFRKLLADTSLADRAPAYRSEWFPRTGVVLRSHFPSARETQLHLIAGTNHEHYDRDSGSFTLWGKGRIVANDFGFNGRAPGDDHNMVVSAGAPDHAVMRVALFRPGASVDYVRGAKNDAWERQIAFVKHPDPLGPNYVVISDRVKSGTATARTWFTAKNVKPAADGALVEGAEDVDTDVFMAGGSPAGPVEPRTRETWGMKAESYGRVATTQLGLSVRFDASTALTTALYPRLKTQPRPAFSAIANGQGVKVTSDAGTDYIFLANARISFREDGIAFDGTVGAILVRKDRTSLWLGQAGKAAAKGRTLSAGAEGGSTP